MSEIHDFISNNQFDKRRFSELTQDLNEFDIEED